MVYPGGDVDTLRTVSMLSVTFQIINDRQSESNARRECEALQQWEECETEQEEQWPNETDLIAATDGIFNVF